MPGLNDDLGDELEEVTEDTEETTDDGGDEGAKEPPKGDAKRIADLQSKADIEAARANKAEKALAAIRGEGAGAGSNDPATKALIAELREASLDAVFGQYPEFAEYGIERDLIEGTTRAEMRESASNLVSLIKNVSTKARNKALAEAGIKAEPTGAARKPPKSASEMTDEDFLKMLDSIS
jgi:hypothetical protein